jgi:citronellol/citronellal dehydrogenase
MERQRSTRMIARMPAKDTNGASEIFAHSALEGTVALVTGGGTGLGKEIAAELARCGALVTIAGRRAEVLEEAAADLASAGDVDFATGDIREQADARAVVAAVVERRGRLDVLVNNAGGQYFAPAEAIATKGWRAVWRLNVDGMLNMSEAAHELAFATAGGGTIVNTTLSPHHGMPGMAHSGSARATVEALTRELAQRWSSDGVTVVAAAPGHFATEVTKKYPQPVREGASRSVPLQRLGEVPEHAWLVTLLCSPLGRAFNGSTVTLDGARDNWYGAWPPAGLADESGEVPTEAREGAG